MRYPDARRLDLVEVLHGHSVADPYRWLEDAATPETVRWSAAQDDLTDGYVAGLDGRSRLKDRLHGLLPGFVGAPLVIGARRFWMQRRPDQDHAVLWTSDHAGPRVLIDPSALSAEHTTTLDAWSVSNEGAALAYQLSEGGDEESVLRVMDVGSGEVIDGPIDRARYSSVAWLPGGEAFYYVRRLAPDLVPEGEAQFHRRVWLHRVGTSPESDVLVFGDGVDKTAYLGVDVSDDGRWAAVTVNLGTAPRNDLYLADLTEGAAALDWRAVLVGADVQAWPHLARDGRLYLLTDLDAPRRRLCVADPQDPSPDRWVELLAEDPAGGVLNDFALAGNAVVAVHSHHAVSSVTVHDRLDGRLVAEVDLPGPGTADVTGRPDEGPEVWVGYTDHVTPYRVLTLDPDTAQLADDIGDVGDRQGGKPAVVHRQQVTYRSADGTEVRMFVISPPTTTPDAGADRPRPTILYGYGGFNVPMTPAYSSSILAWVEAGGVYAIACLRGGAEEGEAWHRDGMRENKHHVFEDFEAAALWLIAGGWTTADQLAAVGGSNGGLLVGAAVTRRPDLFAAAVCSAPLLDMVRYERFGLGQTWSDEYGRAEDPTELEWLLGYSPYHHVISGLAYPAVLFTVFDGDTRVDPLHGRKMCAALQAATSEPVERRPILLRREANVGHGARSVTRTVELAADQLGFAADQLGLAWDHATVAPGDAAVVEVHK